MKILFSCEDFSEKSFASMINRARARRRQPRLLVWIVFGKKFRDDFAAFPNQDWFARRMDLINQSQAFRLELGRAYFHMTSL